MNESIIIALIFLNIYLVLKKIKQQDKVSHKYFLAAIFLLHYIAFIAYYKLSVVQQKDSFLFYQNALEANSILDFKIYGSQLMSIICYPFSKVGVNYFVLSLTFATIGFLGFLKYFQFLISRLDKNFYGSFIALFLLIPSLHFWTAGLTKETIIFYLMSIIFVSTFKNHRPTLLVVVSLFIVFLIRPYLLFILIIAFSIDYFLNFKGSLKEKRITMFVVSFIAILLTPILLNFLKLTEFNLERIKYNFASLVKYSQNFGGSSIDLKNSTYLERLFLVFFRPLFYDAKTLFQYFISFENLIAFFLLINFLKDIFIRKVKLNAMKNELFLLVTVILLILFYGIYMYNLGLASRMRVMFIPYMFIFLFVVYFKNHKNRSE